MNSSAIHQRLIKFVMTRATTPDLQYRYVPPSLTEFETAAYLLLVACIIQGAKAERIGEFVRHLWNNLGGNLFEICKQNPESIKLLVKKEKANVSLARSGSFDDAIVLQSASSYLNTVGNLVLHALKFTSPEEMVNHMALQIAYFGRDPAGARKKAWMFMRWMVRPSPDLQLFKNFHPRDLEMPLDRNTCRAFATICNLLPADPILAEMNCINHIPQADSYNRRLATSFARTLFPDDPVIMDYPLFLLGRSNNPQSELLET